MDLKVLENDGTVISGTDGAIINRTLNFQNGIVRGRYGNFAITTSTNSVTIQPGHLLIEGLNIILDEATTISISSTAQETRVFLVVDIRATNNEITAELYASDSPQWQYQLSYTGEKVSGRYTYQLGYIMVGPSGITSSHIWNEFAQSYPSLYQYVITISSQIEEGAIELNVIFLSRLSPNDLDGFTIDDFLEEGKDYQCSGLVNCVDSEWRDKAGLVRFDFGERAGCTIYTAVDEDWFTLQGDEHYEIASYIKIF